MKTKKLFQIETAFDLFITCEFKIGIGDQTVAGRICFQIN